MIIKSLCTIFAPFRAFIKKPFYLSLAINKEQAEELITAKLNVKFLYDKYGPFLKIKRNTDGSFIIDAHYDFPFSILKYQHPIPYFKGIIEEGKPCRLYGHFHTRFISKLSIIVFLVPAYAIFFFAILNVFFNEAIEAKIACALLTALIFVWLKFMSKLFLKSENNIPEYYKSAIQELFKTIQ